MPTSLRDAAMQSKQDLVFHNGPDDIQVALDHALETREDTEREFMEDYASYLSFVILKNMFYRAAFCESQF